MHTTIWHLVESSEGEEEGEGEEEKDGNTTVDGSVERRPPARLKRRRLFNAIPHSTFSRNMSCVDAAAVALVEPMMLELPLKVGMLQNFLDVYQRMGKKNSRKTSLAIVVVLWRLLHSWKFSCTTCFWPNCLLMVTLQISCFEDPPLKHDGELSCMAAIWYAASNGNHLINGDFELSPNIWNTDWWSASWISECSCNLKKCSQVQLISEEMFSSTTIPLPSSCGCCWSRSQSTFFARVNSGASSHVWELDEYLCWR